MKPYGTSHGKLKRLFFRNQQTAAPLYAAIVAAARQPKPYRDWLVADTPDGRLAMLLFWLWLALRRLRGLGDEEFAQKLVEEFFADMEGNLREQGVSDVAIPRQMRALEGRYMRHMMIYEGVGPEAAGLAETLQETLHDGRLAPDEALIAHCQAARRHIEQLAPKLLYRGQEIHYAG